MIEMLLGHIVGDYVLQNDPMAKGKSKPGMEGSFYCALHCVIYSAVLAAFMIHGAGWRLTFKGFGEPITSWGVAWLIACLTHYPIDRYTLGKWWMKFYGQTMEGPFMPIVHIGVDNSVHLVLMYVLFRLLGGPA